MIKPNQQTNSREEEKKREKKTLKYNYVNVNDLISFGRAGILFL